MKVSKTTVTIYCHCAYYQIIQDRIKFAVLDAIKKAGTDFIAVPDLCEMSAKRDPTLKLWAKADTIKIVACYPRAVRWLFYAAGAPLPQEGVEFLNMRVDGTEKIISSLLQDARYKTQDPKLKTQNSKLKTNDWIPWFPVIDYDRCKNCKQCFNFCLFGVYELTEQGKVQVKNPANCKTNCPACARMCPNSAIMFPKYTDSPINGDAVDEKALEAEKSKINIKEFMDGNVYDAIRRHSEEGRRFSKNREQHYE